MSVRKRKWTTRRGEAKEAWIVDYTDQQGDRHIETFERKKDADTYHATVRVDVEKGVHTPTNRSIAVREATADWIRWAKGERLEPATIAGYQQHVDKHILPRIGGLKLATLTTPRIEAFRDDLLGSGMSRPMAKKVLGSLKAILRDARRRGNVAQNAAADVKISTNGRAKSQLVTGKDFPTRDEVRRILDAAPDGRGRALLMTAAFTGLRASELRGLRWGDVALPRGKLSVVDKHGKPKYGMHAFRHFYASWCINRRQDGGLELPPKTVQARLGHASIVDLDILRESRGVLPIGPIGHAGQ